MKKGLLVLVFAMVFFPASAGAARILKQQGDVRVSASGGKDKESWSDLKGLKTLPVRIFIRTGKDSFLDLELTGGALLRVPAESLVVIEKSETVLGDAETQTDVREGRAVCVVGELSARSKFEVKMSVGVCGARSGQSAFDVSARGPFRCETGELVALYVVKEIPMVHTLRGKEMLLPPRSDSEKLQAVEIEKEEFAKLSAEVEDLKASKRAAPEK